jgi:hypothetical protein
MLRFAWRWAQVGDPVLVHDRKHPEKGLLEGTVAFVRRANRITQLGIRVTDNDNSYVVWPAPACVHPDPLDPDEACWTCDQQLTATSLPPTNEFAA